MVERQFINLSSDQRRQIFIYLNIAVVVAASTYLIITPFYPPLAQKRNLNPILIGLVFAVEPIASAIACLKLGKMISFWGRKRIILLGIISVFIGIAMFAMIFFVYDPTTFLIMSLLSRLLQGIGCALIYTIVYSVIANIFPKEDCAKNIAITEIC